MALVVLSIGVIGGMGMCEWAEQGLQRGVLANRALSAAESCLEAKRSLPWEGLLWDDLDQDGVLESRMHDDGLQGDEIAGDGIFTGSLTKGDMRLLWTVEFNRSGQGAFASLATIEARAMFTTIRGREHAIRLRTIVANPRYVGASSL